MGLCEPHGVQHGQVQGLASRSGQSQAQIEAGEETGLKAALRGRMRGCWLTKQTNKNPQHEPEIYVCSPESQPCPGLLQKQHDQQVEGGYHPPLLCTGVM